MSFDPGARLDPTQVRDVRGRGGAIAGIGGAGVLVLALVYVLLGGDPADLQGALSGPQGGEPGPGSTTLQQECRTGADANERDDCRILGYVNSVQAFWEGEFKASAQPYQPAETVLFTGSVQTGCGTATSQVGPFYCPTDGRVYVDLDFFAVLRSELGAQGGSLAQGYVVAHEYGHHVQNLLGVLGEARSGDTGPDSGAVRVELQADCYAGAWANKAEETGFLQPLTKAQIADALDAAAAVGDDRIQQKAEGQVNPERWTHGSGEMRQQWFTTGYESGDPARCDTFSG
ncbi:MAG TPA: neutral zinc metallopeptidase [Candidatus Limnocylindrales bacterium]|nr:neutral zinc metallopeptidase [Candidatus Limnocylindrales bacterium]